MGLLYRAVRAPHNDFLVTELHRHGVLLGSGQPFELFRKPAEQTFGVGERIRHPFRKRGPDTLQRDNIFVEVYIGPDGRRLSRLISDITRPEFLIITVIVWRSRRFGTLITMGGHKDLGTRHRV